MNDEKVAAEVAEAEFERFLDAMDLHFDEKGMDDEDRKSFFEAKKEFLRAMQRGDLTVDDDGQPVFRPPDSDIVITFYEPTGATFMAADTKKKDHDQAKFYAMLADMTKQPIAVFSKMKKRHAKVCTALGLLFLG